MSLSVTFIGSVDLNVLRRRNFTVRLLISSIISASYLTLSWYGKLLLSKIRRNVVLSLGTLGRSQSLGILKPTDQILSMVGELIISSV